MNFDNRLSRSPRLSPRDFLYRTWRNSTASLRKARILSASRLLVTPFSGFILSSFYLSSEIQQSGLNYLNPRSRDLDAGARPDIDGQVIYVQVDQLEEFLRNIMPTIRREIILITGKWHLPSLRESKVVETISKSTLVRRWYSQNQVFKSLPVLPFPFGVELSTAPLVHRLMSEVPQIKATEVLVPHVRIHPHFSAEIRALRGALVPIMGRELKVKDYLMQIAGSKFVVSPPGDRPDTYRHWESIALGAKPVGMLDFPLRDLFGDSFVSIDGFDNISTREMPESNGPDSSLVLLERWRREVMIES